MDKEKEEGFDNFYIKDKKLGEGMHAVVYKCFKVSDTEKKEPFAVKISLGDDIEKKMAFKKEYTITKKLFHKNIVRSYEYFSSDFSGETHQVMEYVDGAEVFEQISKLGCYTEEDA